MICRLWSDMGFELDSALASDFISDVVSDVDSIRESSSLALTSALESDRSQVSPIIQLAIQAYQDKLYVSTPVFLHDATMYYVSIFITCW